MLLLLLLPLYSGELDPRVIERDSPLYDYLDILYSLSGKAKPNTNRPWTESQARLYISEIDYSSLSEEGKAIYRKAEEEIGNGLRWEMGEDFGLTLGLTFNNEFYVHTDSSFDTEEEWVRSWNDRRPLIEILFEASSSNNLYTSADILYRYGRATTEDHFGSLIEDGKVSKDSYVGTYKIEDSDTPYIISSDYFSSLFTSNFFTDTRNFSFIWPHRAIFSVGGDSWNLSFNRDRLKIGDSHIGSLLIDDHSDYSDYIRTTFFNKYFTYDWILMSLNTLVTDSEDKENEARLYMVHTLDFRILDKVSLKLSENIMYKYSVLNLGFLNPSFFFHNLNNRSLFNALAYIEVNINPFQGLAIYGQYAMDQARAPNEGDSQSDASGFSLGAEYTFSSLKGVFEAYCELLYTTPLLYRRDGVDFIKASRYYHMDGDNGSSGHMPFFEYIGYRYGGDTRTVKLGLDYFNPSWGKTKLYCQLMEHGEMSIYSSHNSEGNNEDDANIAASTPSGDTTVRAIVMSLYTTINLDSIFHWPMVSGEMEMDWIGRWDYLKSERKYSSFVHDLQVSLGITVAL